jgi:2,5-diketo-D-gluconate reductase A
MSTNMNKERNSNGISRRQFLQTSAEFAASAMFLSLGSAQSFATPNASTQKNLTPLVTLNNGVQMPRLGFPQSFNVDDWNSLFFRLQVSP